MGCAHTTRGEWPIGAGECLAPSRCHKALSAERLLGVPRLFNTATVKSTISYIDGDKGILRYRGYPIEQLAEKSSFLEVREIMANHTHACGGSCLLQPWMLAQLVLMLTGQCHTGGISFGVWPLAASKGADTVGGGRDAPLGRACDGGKSRSMLASTQGR